MFSQRPVRSVFRLALAGLMLCGGLRPGLVAAQELPAALALVPADAQAVVIVPNLASFKQKVALINQELDLDSPGMADVLTEFRHIAGIRKGLDESGALVVATSNLSKMTDETQPAAVMLVPVSDYAEFVGNYSDATDSGTTVLNMPWGQAIHCRKSSTYAVLSARKSVVDSYQPGADSTRFAGIKGGFAATYLATSDLMILVDIQALGPMLAAQFEEMVKSGQEMLDTAPPAVVGMTGRAAKTMSVVAIDAAKAILRDTDLAAITVDIGEDGLGLSLVAQFKPGSKLAQMFGQSTANGRGDALARFPVAPYMLATSVNWSALDVAKLVNVTKANLKEHDLEWLADVVDRQVPVSLWSKITHSCTVNYLPEQLDVFNPAAQFTGAGATMFETDDPGAFVTAFKAYVTGMNDTHLELPALPGPSGKVPIDAPPVKIRMSSLYSPNAQVIDNVQIDQWEITHDVPFQLMATVGPVVNAALMAGRAKRGFLAVVDRLVIVTSTDDDELLSQILAAVKKNKGVGSDRGLIMVRSHLPADATYRGYIGVTDIVAGVRDSLSAFMSEESLGWMETDDLPPIGWALALSNAGAVERVFLPMPVMRTAVTPIKQLHEAMTRPAMAPEMVDQGSGRMGLPGRPGAGGRPGMPAARPGMPRGTPDRGTGGLLRRY